MSGQATETASPIYDNNGQYTRSSILRYEKIFGPGYISTSGPETTDYLCSRSRTSCARGGSRARRRQRQSAARAFHLADKFGAVVTGIDLAPRK